MAAVITDVQPRRFRAGDTITVTGSGFSAAFGINRVNVNLGTPATILSESDTVIAVEVPAGIPTNQQVEVIASRTDTQEGSIPFAVWSLASLDEIRDLDLPGQVPGPREAAHLDIDVKDIGQARDYERAAAHVLRIANEILEQAGDIFASDGSLPVRFPIGGGEMELHARPAEALDLHWGPASRWIPFRWGLLEDGTGAAIDMVANGTPEATATTGTEHGIPFDGELKHVGVLNNTMLVGDTLFRVRVLINAVQVHDSGVALGLTEGQSYIAALSIPVNAEDRIGILITKAGGNGDSTHSAVIRMQETLAVAVADLVQVSDAVEVVKTGSHERSAQDAITIADIVTPELS